MQPTPPPQPEKPDNAASARPDTADLYPAPTHGSPLAPVPDDVAELAKVYEGKFSDKKYRTALLLSLMLGYYGADRFYLGYYGLGFAKLALVPLVFWLMSTFEWMRSFLIFIVLVPQFIWYYKDATAIARGKLRSKGSDLPLAGNVQDKSQAKHIKLAENLPIILVMAVIFGTLFLIGGAWSG